MKNIKRLFNVDPWKVYTNTLDKENKRLQESLTSIGNGYMGMRGNFEETYSGEHHNGTYIAGVWYPDKTKVGWWKNGYPDYFGKVINAVNFIAMDIYINDIKVDLNLIDTDSFYMELNMKNGLLKRKFVVDIDGVKAEVNFERFLSIVEKELAVIKCSIKVISGKANIKIISKVDGNVRNEDSNYEEMFWVPVVSEINDDYGVLTTKTIENNFGIERFTVTAGMKNYTDGKLFENNKDDLKISQSFEKELDEGEVFEIEKHIYILTSRDIKESEQSEEVVRRLNNNDKKFDELLSEQTNAWEKRWEIADVVINGDDAAQQGIRFNLFQLFATYYGEDERLNIGPKGFTGEKYGGATYWDTEAYAVPLYLSLSSPEVTKNLLKYRHNQLPEAKINARKQGLKGALYPMVTFTGIECHNEWEITFEEIHRNGSIAYAIYNYSNYTGDYEYVKNEGFEVLIEISRFWVDRVHFSKRNNKYMIHGVTGPNEYENNVNNNWYTNRIASWTLKYTLDIYNRFKKEIEMKLSVEEINKWKEIIDNMYYPYDEELGVFVQHDTFLDKDLMNVDELSEGNLPLNQNWSWDKILRSCFIKQADVLQGIYYFGNEFTLEEKKNNFKFYEPMTVHESSLSSSIHSVIASEIGMEDKAVEMYERSSRLDLDNYNNDTEDGLHITSMTGSWLAIVQGFAQMKTFDEEISFAPFIPKNWESYEFHINYRNRLLLVNVNRTNVDIKLVSGENLNIKIYGKDYDLRDSISIKIKENN